MVIHENGESDIICNVYRYKIYKGFNIVRRRIFLVDITIINYYDLINTEINKYL